MEQLANAALGIGAGVYLGAVVWNGNLGQFGSAIAGESGYLEFMAALFVISLLASWGPTSTFTDAAIVIALAGLALRVATNTPQFVSAAQDFGNGNISLFGFVAELIKGPN